MKKGEEKQLQCHVPSGSVFRARLDKAGVSGIPDPQVRVRRKNYKAAVGKNNADQIQEHKVFPQLSTILGSRSKKFKKIKNIEKKTKKKKTKK